MDPRNQRRKEPILSKGSPENGASAAKDVSRERPTARAKKREKIDIQSPNTLINRELSWLSFARRVLALAQDPELPLLERVKFAGIMGMLYDEFAMKRLGGIKRK
ncbi:MAG: RNA degradosome polyphosphate kinase, partial [Deltaproteobacteria bacterium]|nr:RNA degradosome polyphosphate kinase [Deltaproteobacteria bacterium]